YDAPAGGKRVGDTLIVSVDAGLQSVGVVQVHVVDGEAEASYAARIEASDVKNPAASSLAKSYGITEVPADQEVLSYINSLYTEQILSTEISEKLVVDAPKVEIVSIKPTTIEQVDVSIATIEPIPSTPNVSITNTVVVQPPIVETISTVNEIPAVETKIINTSELLNVQQPQGIVTGSSEVPSDTFDFGATTSIKVARYGALGTGNSSVRLSVNPYFSFNAFSLGLQLVVPSPATIHDTNVLYMDFSSVLDGMRSTLSFIDYVRYGAAQDNFYLLADDHTPIRFSNSTQVRNLAVESYASDEHLGFYMKGSYPTFGFEVFFDDLYLHAAHSAKDHFAGVAFTFTPSPLGYPFTFGVSSLVRLNIGAQQVKAYPALNFTFPIKDERTLGVSAFLSAATALGIAPFDTNIAYDSTTGTLTNLMVATGIDIRSLDFTMRFAAAFVNNTDEAMEYGFLNDTFYNGTRIVSHPSGGWHWNLAADATYASEKLSVGGSLFVPVSLGFDSILPTAANASLNADVAKLFISYTGMPIELSLGFKRIGFTTAFATLFDFSSGFSGFISNVKNFIFDGRDTQPYFSASYRSGIFDVSGSVLMGFDGTSYMPKIELASHVSLTPSILDDLKRSDLDYGVFSKNASVNWSSTLGVGYDRLLLTGADKNYLTLRPLVSYTGTSFSIGIGPKITLDMNGSIGYANWYTHDDSKQFSFGTDYVSLSRIGLVYDALTDVFGLIDHVSIGSEASAFRLVANKTMDMTLGELIRGVSATEDHPFADRLALFTSYDGRIFSAKAFMNDMTEMQLGALYMSLTPFRNWKGSLSLGLNGSAKISGASKRLDLFPSMEVSLPVLTNERYTLGLEGTFTTLIGVDSAYPGWLRQMLYTGSSGSFITDLDNYLVGAHVHLEFGNTFAMRLTAALQEGAVSYGMFDNLFFRNRAFINASIDKEWNDTGSIARTWLAAAEFSSEAEHGSLSGTYRLPFSSTFTPIWANDYLSFKGELETSFGALRASFSKKGLAGAVQNLINGSLDVGGFFLSGQSALNTSVTIVQGPIDFTLGAGLTAQYQADTTWNGAVPKPVPIVNLSTVDVRPTVSFLVNLRLF
ncbi:MAG: hypothetical protein PHH86_00005, partial [Sphaerochaetaceae bacterium]|nr:hypothetical protein [Sphaerochaetaceae bacterium]